MSTIEETPSAQAQALAAKQTFFRQSSWMMITNVAAGVFMFSVHLFANKIGVSE